MQNLLNIVSNQDCLEYLKSLPSECCNLALIDEPYGILTGHKIESEYNYDVALQVRQEIYRVLKKDAWFVWFGIFPNAYHFYTKTLEAGFKPWQACNEIVWCKRNVSNPFLPINRIHENIFVFQKGKPEVYENQAPASDLSFPNACNALLDENTFFTRLQEYEKIVKSIRNNIGKIYLGAKYNKLSNLGGAVVNDNLYSNYHGKNKYRYDIQINITSIMSFLSENQTTFTSVNKQGTNIKHPTTKPLLLFRRLIKLFTQKDDVVLDCFMGSGTTAVASKQEGRNFLGCERDVEYCNIINERLDNWLEDLKAKDKWLKERGVMNFESDIKDEINIQEQGSLF